MILSLALTTLVPTAQAQAYPYTVQVDEYFDLAYGHAVADMDGDGDVDIVLSRYGEIAWLDNQGDGLEWVERAVVQTEFTEIHVADLDGDGDPDIIGVSSDGTFVFENVAAGALFTEITVTTDRADVVDVGDVDGDGQLDLVTLDLSDDTLSWHAGNGSIDGFGPGDFIGSDPNYLNSSLLVEDFDGDGSAEIWVTSPEFGYEFFSIYTYAGGAFDEEERAWTNWTDIPRTYARRDLDADGDLDMIVGTATRIEQWENLGGIMVLDEVIFDASPSLTSPAPTVGDVDLDGDLDLVVGTSEGSFVDYWENDGGEYTVDVISTQNNSASKSTDLVDLDCDGDLDFVVTASFGSLEIFLNQTVPGPSSCGADPTDPDPTDPDPTDPDPTDPDPTDPDPTDPDPTDPDPTDPEGDGSILESETSCNTAMGTPAVWSLMIVPALALLRRRRGEPDLPSA